MYNNNMYRNLYLNYLIKKAAGEEAVAEAVAQNTAAQATQNTAAQAAAQAQTLRELLGANWNKFKGWHGKLGGWGKAGLYGGAAAGLLGAGLGTAYGLGAFDREPTFLERIGLA